MNRNNTSKVLLILLTNVGTAIITVLVTGLIAENTTSRAPHYWAAIITLLEVLILIFVLLLGCYIAHYLRKLK